MARVLITRAAGAWPELDARFAGTSIDLQWEATTRQGPPADPAPGDAALAKLDRFDWLVAASPRGVEAFHARLSALRSEPLPPWLQIAAVGPATAEALAAKGLRVDLVAAQASSAGVAAALRPHASAGARVLVIRPEGPKSALAKALREAGAAVDEAPLYRTVATLRAEALAQETIEGRFAAIAFTAPSSLSLWLSAADACRESLEAALRSLRLIAIGPTTAAYLESVGLPAVETAEAPVAGAVGDAIARALPDNMTSRTSEDP